MSDTKLRDLERAAAHGDLQAQARLLLERVRVGDLTEERLRLAAYLGDEAARVALGDAAPERFVLTLPEESIDGTVAERTHGGWVRTLFALGGREVLARAVAVAMRVSAHWDMEQAAGAPYLQRSFQRSIEALEGWVAQPCEATFDRCYHHVGGDSWFERAVAKVAVRGEDQLVGSVMAVFVTGLMGPDGRPVGVDRAQAAIVTALVPWALASRGSST